MGENVMTLIRSVINDLVENRSNFIKKSMLTNDFINNLMWSLHFIENYLKSNNKTSDETEIQIDILRRRILEFEDCFELLLNKYIFSTERYPEIENIYQKLFDLYDLLVREYAPQKSYLTNLYEYRQLIELERKLGYPLMRRPLELPIQTSLPSREPKFMQRENEVEDILIRLNRDKKPTLCISGVVIGDENAGLGKSVLATEIGNLVTLNKTELDKIEYINTSPSLQKEIEIFRNRFDEGIIWISLQSYKKSNEEYILELATNLNLPYKRNEIIENPIENNKTNEVTKENRGATFDNLNSNQKDEYSDSTDVDEINNYIIKESHLKIDCIEKIALILSTKKILLILDNVEQDRLAFQYLYSHLVGFVTILITCRVRLLGIELFLIKNFNLKQALMFFQIYLERSIKGVKILKLSEKVIDKLNYNPFALQLLATNSKDNLEKNLRELVEYEMYDHSTVSKIAAVLDITNALTDEEKSLLFKASLFLNEYFSGFESYCYEIDKSQVEINTTLYNLYLEKKILKIKSIDSDKITEYKIHESIIKYLNQWHLKTYGLVSVADDKIFSHLKRKLNSNNEELRQKNKTKQKRLFLLFDNLAILKVTNDKSINTQNSIENYFNNIIFEYSNKSDSDKRQYFQSQHFISNVSNYAYYEYTLIEGFIIDKKYYQCIFQADQIFRNCFEIKRMHEFQSSILGALSAVNNFYYLSIAIDYAISGFIGKLKNWKAEGLNNQLNVFEKLIQSSFNNSYLYTSIKDAINDIRYINEYEYSWEFNFKKLAFDISLYQNRTDTEKNLQELKELKSKPEIDDFNEKIISPIADWLLIKEQYTEAFEQIIQMKDENDEKLQKLCKAYIGLGKYENANEILNQLNTMAEQFQSIRLLTEILNLKAFLNLNQGNFANAALLIEQCIKTKLSYNISNLFEEEYLKEKIINKVGSEEGYFELLKSQNITPIISLSKFMNPEIEIMDSRNKKMILIPSGRVFYEDKPPFLLDSAFILKNVEPLLKNEFDLSYIDDFSKETVVYSFYVDEETVSEDEFNTYFLAQSDSIEKPSFTAENVIEFSESQGKIPLTTMEWTKLYKGLNYNLSDQCKLFNSNYSEEKYSEYFNTFYNTIQISESYNNVYDVLALLKFNKRNKFSTKLPYDTSLLVLIAFSNILDTSEKKLKVLQNLAHSDSDQRETLFEILKDGIRDFKDRLSSNKEYLKLFGISQKNIWQITLKYFFDIEMKFNIIKENDPQEAVIMAKDGINYLVSKNPNKGMWTQDNIISSSKFIPFRCMKIVNHEYKQN